MKRVHLLLVAAVITGITGGTIMQSVAQGRKAGDPVARKDLDQTRHEVSIYGGGGISSLQYKLSTGKHNIGFGTQFGVSYAYFFTPNWSLGTALEAALYNAKSKLSNFSDNYEVEGEFPEDNYTYSYDINSYTERHQSWYINIPLMAQFQTGGTHKFYAALGGKVGFHVKSTAKTDNYTAATRGYFPAEGRTYDDLRPHGFDAFDYNGSKTDLDKLKINAMVSAEVGAKFKVGGKHAIGLGVYFDYGVLNLQKTNDKTFVESTLELAADKNPTMSPLIESKYSGKGITNKIASLAVGLKFKVSFGCGKNFQSSGGSIGSVTGNNVRADGTSSNTETRKPSSGESTKKSDTPKQQSPEEKEKQDEAKRKSDEAKEIAHQKLEEQRGAARAIIQEPLTHFPIGQSGLTATHQSQLDRKIEQLKQYPNMDIYVFGHTCDIGDEKSNAKLGLQRARNVRDYLISKGISRKRILGTGSKFDTQPLAPNTTEANRQKNRRVQIVVVE